MGHTQAHSFTSQKVNSRSVVFSNLFRVAAPCRREYTLRRSVTNPQEFAVEFDGILKMHRLTIY